MLIPCPSHVHGTRAMVQHGKPMVLHGVPGNFHGVPWNIFVKGSGVTSQGRMCPGTGYSGLSLLQCLIIRNATYYDTRSISQLLQTIRNFYWIIH